MLKVWQKDGRVFVQAPTFIGNGDTRTKRGRDTAAGSPAFARRLAQQLLAAASEAEEGRQ